MVVDILTDITAVTIWINACCFNWSIQAASAKIHNSRLLSAHSTCVPICQTKLVWNTAHHKSRCFPYGSLSVMTFVLTCNGGVCIYVCMYVRHEKSSETSVLTLKRHVWQTYITAKLFCQSIFSLIVRPWPSLSRLHILIFLLAITSLRIHSEASFWQAFAD